MLKTPKATSSVTIKSVTVEILTTELDLPKSLKHKEVEIHKYKKESKWDKN